MAPEQAIGQWVDGRCDLYALGCVLYMMLAGAPPFNAATPILVLDLHLDEPPVPLRAHRDDVPPDLQQLVAELLAKDRDDRPATARSVRDRLLAIAGRPAAVAGNANRSTAALAAVEAAPTQPLAAFPPAPAASGGLGTSGRHRTLVPGISRYRRRVSGWVAALVAVALVTAVLAAAESFG
jgi:serine/threonine-protein kinase